MLLTKNELDILLKKFPDTFNSTLDEIKCYSQDKLRKTLVDIQNQYENEDYSCFADLADDIISNKKNKYKEFSSTDHFKNIFLLSKTMMEDYIHNLNSLIKDESKNIAVLTNKNDEIEKIKLMKEKEFLTTEEVSTIYQIKRDKLLELRTKKLLKYFQLEENGKVLFKKEDVDEFMKKNTF